METTVEFSAFRIANEADCSCPDSPTSAGAVFLTSIQDAVNGVEIESTDIDDYADQLTEIADDAPDIYTATLWAEFVDLGAWQEDPSEVGYELGTPDSSMEGAARVCLYLIAERAARWLMEQRLELVEEEADDDDDDGTDRCDECGEDRDHQPDCPNA